jgi:F-type H+-transporting ATPase subunit b
MMGTFGLNTDLFETNILNLSVVVSIVFVFVGDALKALLARRRDIVISSLQEATRKAREADQRIEEARKSVDVARLRAQEIRVQAVESCEREKLIIKEQMAKELEYLKARGQQAIELEYRRTSRAITKQVFGLALVATESTLITELSSQDPSCSKQRELNEIYLRESFFRLK